MCEKPEWSNSQEGIKCSYCGEEYKTISDYQEDCFVSSDGWSWDYFHSCLKDMGNKIHGYNF